MSLQHSSSSTGDFPPKFYPVERPENNGAPRSKRPSSTGWNSAPSSRPRIKPMDDADKVVDAKPVPNNPHVYAVEDKSAPPPRPQASSGLSGGAASPPDRFTGTDVPLDDTPSQRPRADRGWDENATTQPDHIAKPSPERAPSDLDNAPRSYSVGIRRMFILGVGLDGKTGVYVNAYVNLKLLAVVASAAFSGVFKGEDIGNALSALIKQLLS